MMRVTDFLRHVENRNSRMYDLQNQIASGYRLHRPSDDPVGVHQTLLLTEQIARNEQYGRNLENGLSRLSFTENSLSEISNLINSIYSTGIQGDNDTMSTEDLEALAVEVEQLIQQLVSEANSQYNGVYVFAGQWTQTMPFDDVQGPGGITTSVSQAVTSPMGEIFREINVGDLIAINIPGDQLFMPDGEGEMTDLFWVAMGIRDFLNNNNEVPPSYETVENINELLEALEAIRERVAGFQTTVGARVDRMNNVSSQLLNTNLTLTDSLSNIADTDLVQATMDLQSDQVAYQATLNVGALVLQPSLLDYLA
jgi:flagellar hook-associated protein 3 FlgL